MSESEPRIEIRVVRRGRWTRVAAEHGEQDVSHLSYAPMPVRVGPAATVQMAGIAGVGTEPQFRRAGLGRRVFARAMEEIRASECSCVGLYTGTDIVAHRVYRRFGLVDTLVTTGAAKLIHPVQYIVSRLSQLLRADPELASWRCSLQLDLPSCFPLGPLYLLIAGGEVTPLGQAPKQIDLFLSTSSATLIQLLLGMVTAERAAQAKLVQWHGAEAHWQRLAAALDAHHHVVREGG